MKFFLIWIFAAISGLAQEISITQPLFNPIIINPATAGNSENLELVVFHRRQWLGLEGAPVNYIFSGNSILSEFKQNIGIGFLVKYEEILPRNNIQAKFQYAYKIPFKGGKSLALGLDFGVGYESLNLKDFDIFAQDDPIINTLNNERKIAPLLGVGAFYTTSKFYLGISGQNLLGRETIQTNPNDDKRDKFIFNAYLISGYEFKINRDVLLKPAINLSFIDADQLIADFSVNTIIYGDFIIGATYRHEMSIGGNTGFYLYEKKALLGLHYEASISGVPGTDGNNLPSNNGSFELFLKINLSTNNQPRYGKIKTPRFL